VIDTENIVEVELESFGVFFSLFLKTRQRIDEAIILYYSSTPPQEKE